MADNEHGAQRMSEYVIIAIVMVAAMVVTYIVA